MPPHRRARRLFSTKGRGRVLYRKDLGSRDSTLIDRSQGLMSATPTERTDAFALLASEPHAAARFDPNVPAQRIVDLQSAALGVRPSCTI